MRDLLAAHLPDAAERIVLLPRPVRSAPPGDRPAGRRLPGGTRITFAGRITAEKGLDIVLEALAAVDASLSVELCIAGVVESAGHWAHCRDLIDVALAAHPGLTVRVLGHLGYAEVDELFLRSDVVVVPSRWPEPLGAVAAEAMRAGAAVVASRVGGLDTFVSDEVSGLLVPPGRADRWASALTRLARAPTLTGRLAAAGSDAVADLTVDSHLDALDALVASRGRGR